MFLTLCSPHPHPDPNPKPNPNPNPNYTQPPYPPINHNPSPTLALTVTGTLKPLAKMRELRGVDLTNNSIEGTLEPLQSFAPVLREVFLTNNRLCGSLEPLRGCTALQDVVLDSNQLTGGLQPLQSCTALQALYCRCCAPALRPNFARGGSIGSAPVAVYRIGSAVPRACVQVQPAVGRARAAAGVRGAREALPHPEHADGRPRAAPGLPRIAGALPGGQRVSTYEI